MAMAVRPATVLCLVVAAGAALAQGAGRTPDVATARRSLAELNAQESSLALRFGRNRGELARLLGALQLFGRDPPPALLVDPRDAKDAVRAAILIRSIAPPLEARARAMAGEAQALAKVRRRVAAASGDLFAAESALLDKRGRLDGVVSDVRPSPRHPDGRPVTLSITSRPPGWCWRPPPGRSRPALAAGCPTAPAPRGWPSARRPARP